MGTVSGPTIGYIDLGTPQATFILLEMDGTTAGSGTAKKMMNLPYY